MSYKLKLICLYFILLSFFLLFIQVSYAQDKFSGVEEMIKKNQKALGKDVVALVWRDGKVVYRYETGPEFNGKTQVAIGASGQWLTAALAMALLDEKKIALDDKAAKYIPILGKYMKGYITLKHGLTHTTGLEAEKTGVGKIVPKARFESLEEQMEYFASKREIVTNPQTEFYYSHVGMNIAGRMLEVVTKKTFDRIIAEKITRPLKMRGTTFFNYNNMFIDPSTGVQSTANDYINFLGMLLNKGVFEGKQIVSEQAVEEMLKAQFAELPVKYTPKGTEGTHYGFGAWLLEEDSSGNGVVVASPSFTGTWPYIDRKRNYAAILVAKNSKEESNELFRQFKAAVESSVGGN